VTNKDKIFAELQKRKLAKLGAAPPKPKDDIPRYRNGQPRDPRLRRVYDAERQMALACGGEFDPEYFRDVLLHDPRFVESHQSDIQILLEGQQADETAAMMAKAQENHAAAPSLAAGEKNNAIDAQIAELERSKS
jgi:hypothetical protein